MRHRTIEEVIETILHYAILTHAKWQLPYFAFSDADKAVCAAKVDFVKNLVEQSCSTVAGTSGSGYLYMTAQALVVIARLKSFPFCCHKKEAGSNRSCGWSEIPLLEGLLRVFLHNLLFDH